MKQKKQRVIQELRYLNERAKHTLDSLDELYSHKKLILEFGLKHYDVVVEILKLPISIIASLLTISLSLKLDKYSVIIDRFYLAIALGLLFVLMILILWSREKTLNKLLGELTEIKRDKLSSRLDLEKLKSEIKIRNIKSVSKK